MVYAVLVLLGLCFGSFVNALVWRLHEQQTIGERVKGRGLGKKPRHPDPATLTPSDLSILKGRSMCTDCHHTLAWYDLLPVLSWVSLGGKCRYCRKGISWQYPLVELTMAGLFLFSYFFWPFTIHNSQFIVLFAFWLVFLVGFLALAVYDLRWFILPDKIVYPLASLAVLQLLTRVIFFSAGWSALGNAALGVLCLSGLFYALFQISGGKWIGGGDVKLGLVLGILAGGAIQALTVLFAASVLGTIAAIPMIAGKKNKRNIQVPFGPFLLAGTFIVYLFGTGIMAWYKRTLLFM